MIRNRTTVLVDLAAARLYFRTADLSGLAVLDALNVLVALDAELAALDA